MSIRETLWDMADMLWGSADAIAPSGSLGDLIGGFLKIPANVVGILGDIMSDFGS